MIGTERKTVKRIFGLDLLRVISIALVLCSHTSWIYPPSSSLLAKAVDMCGFFGVELFFILSGFLIGSIIYKQFLREDYGLKIMMNFLNRRMVRILPNYYLIILVNIGIGFVIGYPTADSWKYFFFLQNFASPLLPFFPESWSMPIKEYGYLITVFLLLLVSYLFRKVPKEKLFLGVILGMIFFFFALKVQYYFTTLNTTMGQWDLSLRSVVIYRIDSVLMGVLFGYFSCRFPKFWTSFQYKFLGIGFLFLALLLFCLGFLKLKILAYPFFWNVLCLPFNSVALVCFLPFFSNWATGPKLWRKAIEIVSEISYSIYLLHYSIVLYLMKHFIDTTSFSLLQLHLFTLAYVSITIALSFLLYRYFEKPMTQLREKRM